MLFMLFLSWASVRTVFHRRASRNEIVEVHYDGCGRNEKWRKVIEGEAVALSATSEPSR